MCALSNRKLLQWSGSQTYAPHSKHYPESESWTVTPGNSVLLQEVKEETHTQKGETWDPYSQVNLVSFLG